MSARRKTLQDIEKDIAVDIAKAMKAGKGKVFTGNSLALWVRGNSASWIYHYRDGASMNTLSLGTYPALSLHAARQAREQEAAKRRNERDRRAGTTTQTTVQNNEPQIKRKRFADVVESAIPILAARNNWKATSTEPRKYRHLKDGALGKMWTDEIDQTHIADELMKRWGKREKLASADKYRMRIKAVLDNATANKWRPNTPNPADMKIMKHLIEGAPKSTPHVSMPVADVPAFMGELDGSIAARALRFAILTVARAGEAIGARWEEIEGNVWHIPAGRMKEGATNGDHWVPLSPAALALLGKPKKSGRIFDGLPHDALDDKLKEYRAAEIAVMHGFRTSFTGWAEKNGWASRLWDRAMHHSSKVGGSYSREPLTEERRPMMVAWSEFLLTGSAR